MVSAALIAAKERHKTTLSTDNGVEVMAVSSIEMGDGSTLRKRVKEGIEISLAD